MHASRPNFMENPGKMTGIRNEQLFVTARCIKDGVGQDLAESFQVSAECF